jgi:hypothetical protein
MRSLYVKVLLFTDPQTNLQDAKVVGQGSDYLLLERPAPKPRAKKSSGTSVPRKTRSTRAASSQPAVTSFPSAEASNG